MTWGSCVTAHKVLELHPDGVVVAGRVGLQDARIFVTWNGNAEAIAKDLDEPVSEEKIELWRLRHVPEHAISMRKGLPVDPTSYQASLS